MEIEKIDKANDALANLRGLADTLISLRIAEVEVTNDQLDAYEFIIRTSVETLESVIKD